MLPYLIFITVSALRVLLKKMYIIMNVVENLWKTFLYSVIIRIILLFCST